MLESTEQLLTSCIQTLANTVAEVATKERKDKFNNSVANIDPEAEIVFEDCFQGASTRTSDDYCSIFQELLEGYGNETVFRKLDSIQINSISSKRKDLIFRRLKLNQQANVELGRKQVQKNYLFCHNQMKYCGEFSFKDDLKQQILSFKEEDLEKLLPDTDVNDTIIDNYLKIMNIYYLSEEVRQQTFIFSSFFMGKLLGDLLQNQISQNLTEEIISKIRTKVTEGYPSVKRWTKKVDLFSMKYFVIPINAYKHWNSIIVVNPNKLLIDQNQCKIIFLDSMFEKKQIFFEAIKCFLQLELNEKKNYRGKGLSKIKKYQLLVPRQTNTHDCGICTLLYIENLLKRPEILNRNLQIVEERYNLQLFPRSAILAMRELLRRLFKDLLTSNNKQQAISQFRKSMDNIPQSKYDYDIINEKEFQKFSALNENLFSDACDTKEIEYKCLVRFYLDGDANFYARERSLLQ